MTLGGCKIKERSGFSGYRYNSGIIQKLYNNLLGSNEMKDHENTFSHELEVFRTEAKSAIQFFYTFLSINASLANNQKALQIVNETPLFWRTNTGALQTSFFIILGRVFDQNS